MDKKIKWGIIGPGNIAKTFAEALRRSGDSELWAVGSSSRERAESFAAEYGASRAYGDYGSFLEDKELQAVYIATVNSTHMDLIRKCAAAKKAVLCEKPCVLTEADAAELEKLSGQVLIMEGMWTAFLPATRTVKKWIADGKIGNLSHISLSFSFKGDQASRRLFSRELGGGGMYDVGVYCIEYAMELTGSAPEECKSMARLSESGVDEFGTLLMRFPGDIIADCRYGISFFAGSDAHIHGDRGRIYVPAFWSGGSCELYDENSVLADRYVSGGENGFIYEIRHFNRLLSEGRTESDIMPLAKTRSCARVFDKIRAYDFPPCT